MRLIVKLNTINVCEHRDPPLIRLPRSINSAPLLLLVGKRAHVSRERRPRAEFPDERVCYRSRRWRKNRNRQIVVKELTTRTRQDLRAPGQSAKNQLPPKAQPCLGRFLRGAPWIGDCRIVRFSSANDTAG